MEASRFRRDRSHSADSGLGRRQTIALLAALALAVGGVALAASVVKPNRSRAFNLVRGTVFLSDARAPVAVDLATGAPTVRLVNARTQVSAASESSVGVVPLTDSTLLLNRSTGAFNMVDSTGFVIKTTPGGVALPAAGTGTTTAIAVPAGDRAFVVRSTATATAVYLVARTTVESATNASVSVKPRAFRTLGRATTLTSGSAVTADGALWLVTGTGADHVIQRLRVPAGSETGATLDSDAPTTVNGLAVLATAADPRGGTAVGIAGSKQIQVFDHAGLRALDVGAIRGVDRVLPVTTASSTLRYLYHGSGGWHLVSVTDVVRDTPLDTLGTNATLAAPVESNGTVFTMSTATDASLYSIGSGGTVTSPAGAARYPVSVGASGTEVEVSDFADAQVIARQGRVIFNSPDHLLALTLFADGSHAPVTIDKSAAVDLNSIGGATALTKSRTKPAPNGPTQQRPTTAKPVTPQQPVNQKATCATTTQTPHIPAITQATPASRSVRLAWTYPILDNQDCVPSTYRVQVTLLSSSSDVPAAPGQVTVQGQPGVNLLGLYPNTRYEITLTAFINGKGTAAAPVQITTGREGPKAPTAVATKADATGTWTITWTACADAKTGCVPAATWTVTPTFCDGAGLSAPLAPITVSGDSSLTRFTATYGGTPGLLGRGLSFGVQGGSEFGDVGAAGTDGHCTRSWSPPAASQITLTASAPPPAAAGQTTSTTFTLNLGSNPTAATGGAGASFTYQLLSGSTVVASQGPTGATSVSFGGIVAGRTYSGRAIVAPPGHPEAAITVVAPEISTRSNWPAVTITAATVTRDPANPRLGNLAVTVGGVSSAGSQGETFDLSNSVLTCGNAALALTVDGNGFDPASRSITTSLDLTQYYGDCRVTVMLSENAAHATQPPVYGGTASSPAGAAVTMPAPPTATFPASAFSARWGATANAAGHSVVNVAIANAPPAVVLVKNWSYTLTDGPTPDCAVSDQPISGPPPIGIDAEPKCVTAHGADADLDGWSVTVFYQFYGSDTTYSSLLHITGKPPTYSASTTPPPSTTPTPSPTK